MLLQSAWRTSFIYKKLGYFEVPKPTRNILLNIDSQNLNFFFKLKGILLAFYINNLTLELPKKLETWLFLHCVFQIQTTAKESLFSKMPGGFKNPKMKLFCVQIL